MVHSTEHGKFKAAIGAAELCAGLMVAELAVCSSRFSALQKLGVAAIGAVAAKDGAGRVNTAVIESYGLGLREGHSVADRAQEMATRQAEQAAAFEPLLSLAVGQ